jgi:hypothetical protein
LESYLNGIFRRDRYLANLGPEGRAQVYQQALGEFQTYPPETRLVTLFAMRERGLISTSEYYRFAEEQGYTSGQAEHRYRNWTGTESAIFDMKQRGILQHGEYAKLLHAKGISRGAGYYRYRKYMATAHHVPFRGYEMGASRPKRRSKQMP